MSRYNKPQDKTWREYLGQFLVMVVAAFIIVAFLPRDNRETMFFEIGRPWPYGRFIAPYDFLIMKSDAQVQKEHDSIQKIYAPYYEMLPRVASQQIATFKSDFNKQTDSGLSTAYLTYVETRLQYVYEQGIISNDDMDELLQTGQDDIHIFYENQATTMSVAQLFTEKSAYEYIFKDTESQRLNKQKLQHLNLNLYLKSNLIFDEQKSQELWNELEKSLTPSSGKVLAGQNIIDRGDIVDEKTYQILESFYLEQAERQEDNRSFSLILLGQIVYVISILLCLVLYFDLFRQDYITHRRSILLLLFLLLSFPLMTSFMIRHTLLSVYLIPYSMLPIFVRVFMDSRTAFFSHLCTILLCAMSLSHPFHFITSQLVAGLIAIYSLRDLSERSQLIRTAILVTVGVLIFYSSIDLMNGRTFFNTDVRTVVDWNIYIHIIISGILLLFAYPLMYLLERSFGFTSNVTLVELSNINSDLLRRLSEEAPGTFQHSMMVSNLAAEVANKVGAKSQLVRTGALYHDIGKLENPEYFTENQLGGLNPHSMLSCKESAAIILRHVPYGLELADKYNLPQIIKDFISTHHGCGMAKYFYITQKNEHPDDPIDERDYTYSGFNPKTTEQAILMMVDAVEASARSLKAYTEENISELVDRIIDGQVTDGFYKECPITFADIQVAKEVLKGKLKTIYHTRVSYPTLNNTQEDNNTQEGSTSK